MRLVDEVKDRFRALYRTPSGGIGLRDDPAPQEDRYYGSNNVTWEQAITISAVWGALMEISTSMASVPVKLYEGTGQDRRLVEEDPLLTALDGNSIQNGFSMAETRVLHLLMQGNYFAEIDVDSLEGLQLYTINPTKVKVDIKNKLVNYEIDGKTYSPLEIFHIPGASYDARTGLSPANVFGRLFSLMIRTEMFASRLASRPILHTSLPRGASEEDVKVYKKQSDEMYDINGMSSGTIVTTEGITVNALGLYNEEQQINESVNAHVLAVARIFRIPAARISYEENSTYNNRQQDMLRFINDTLKPIGQRQTSAFNYRFLRGTGLYLEYDFNEMKEQTLEEMASVFSTLVSAGVEVIEAAQVAGLDGITAKELSNQMNDVLDANEEVEDEGS